MSFDASYPSPFSSALVVGGGLTGLICGLVLRERGLEVTVVDADLPGRASPVAAGMLAPWAEYELHERDLLPTMVASLAGWPDLARRFVLPESALPRWGGTLLPALTPECEHRLARVVEHLREVDAPHEVISAQACRRREPAVSASVRAGVVLPREGSVDNRAVLTALRKRAQALGIHLRADHVEWDDLDSSTLRVDARGAWQTATDHRVRPQSGMTIRVQAPGVVQHVIRAVVDRRSLYLVPRPNAEVVIGATSLDVGFDATPRVGHAAELLGDAIRVVPTLRDAELVSVDVGLRPVADDGMPRVEMSRQHRTLTVRGLGRHGFLLAPWLARRVDEAVETLPRPRRSEVPA